MGKSWRVPVTRSGLWALARAAARGGRALRTGGRPRSSGGSGVPLLLLGLDELAIVRGIEVEQRSARSEVLDEDLAYHPGRAGGKHRHRQRGDDRANSWNDLERTR